VTGGAPRITHFLALIALTLIALGMLRADPFSGETLAPFDLLVHQPAWRNLGVPPRLVHIQHSDILDFKLPAWRELRAELRAGGSGAWLPSIAAGAPGSHLLIRSALTPAFAAYAFFDDEGLGLYAGALIDLLILSYGGYFLFLALSRRPAAALLGAVVLSYSGFIAGWFYWPHVNTAIWLPWLLYFGLRYLESGRRCNLPWLALASTGMMLGGFPIVVVYALLALGLLAAFRSGALPLSRRERLSRLAELGLFLALSLMMTLFAIVALWEYLGRIDLSYRHGGTAFRSLSDLRLFLLPFSDPRLYVERSVYVGLLPILALGFGLYRMVRRRADWRIAWALSLIAVSLVFAFQLLPRECLLRVPVLGDNPWSRMVLLIDLGLATLAVVFYQYLWEWTRPRLSRWGFWSLMGGLLLAQVVDEGRVFIKRVAPVDTAWIYPLTATISRMREGIAPLQSVLADQGFLVSGTLAAYGLPEWFAHEMHTPAEKRALGRWLARGAFVTPTAARFSCGQVRFSGPGLDYFAVRYVACTLAPPVERLLLDTEQGPQEESGWSAPLGGSGVVQHFRVDATFRPARFRLATAPGGGDPMSLSLYRESGERLGQAACHASGGEQDCVFARSIELTPGAYRLVARSAGAGPRLGYRHLDAAGARLETGRGVLEAMLRMRVYAPPPAPKPLLTAVEKERFTESRPEPGMRLLENRNVTGSVYALGRDGRPDYSLARLVSARPERLEIEYLGDRPAWVVAPMRWYPGWHAWVDGRSATLSRFLGVMPALHLDGPARVRLAFRPTGLPATLMMSLAAWLVWGLALWRWCLSKKRPSGAGLSTPGNATGPR